MRREQLMMAMVAAVALLSPNYQKPQESDQDKRCRPDSIVIEPVEKESVRFRAAACGSPVAQGQLTLICEAAMDEVEKKCDESCERYKKRKDRRKHCKRDERSTIQIKEVCTPNPTVPPTVDLKCTATIQCICDP